MPAFADQGPDGRPDTDPVLASLRARLADLEAGAQTPSESERPASRTRRPGRARAGAGPRGRTERLNAGPHDAPADDPRPGRDDDRDGPDADPEALARTIVLRQLTAQARSRSELARALKRRNVPQEVADAVLDRMEEVGLVDDAGFAQAWVESRQQRRHLSATALRHELRKKGVAHEHVDEALSEVDADDEYAAALALAQQKRSRMRGLDSVTVRRRLAGVLGRRGFGTGIAVRVLDEVMGQTGDVDA